MQESSWSTTKQPRTKSPECDAPRPGCFNPCSCLVGIIWSPGAQCVGGDAVLRFTCRFGGWKNHTRRLDHPVGLPPSTRDRSTASNGQRRIGRCRIFTAFISSLPSWPRTALDRVPRHPATPRRWAELMSPFADPGAALPTKSCQYAYPSQKQILSRKGPVAVSPCKGMGQWH
jgi:hypothetical protein